MGNSSSTSIIKQVNETINETTFDFISSKTTSTKGTSVSTQSMDVSNVKAVGCVLEVSQSATIEQTVIQEVTQEDIADLTTRLEVSIDNTANTSADSSTSWGAMGSSDSFNKQEVTNLVKNVIKKSVTSISVNEIINNVYNTQTQQISNVLIDPCYFSLYDKLLIPIPSEILKECDTTKVCKITQDATIKTISTQIANMVTTAIQNDEVLGSLISKSTASASSKNMGVLESLGKAFSDMIKSFGSGGGIVILIIIVAVVILIIMMKK
jgi:hypothetical protein